MAIVLALAGSILGIAAAVTALVLLDIGFLVALGIWSGTGIAFTLVGVALACLPGPASTCQGRTRTA